MATVEHFSELQLLALLDEELPRTEAAAARSHLTRCFPCHRLYEGLRRESDVLRAAAAPETSSTVQQRLHDVARAGGRASMAADGPIILVKIGGSTLGADDTSFGDIVALQQQGARPVVVHGGGPAITSWMAKMGIPAEFVRGLRVTDAPSLDVATAILAGLINKQLVAALRSLGANAVGISGADGGLLRGTIVEPELGAGGGGAGRGRFAARRSAQRGGTCRSSRPSPRRRRTLRNC